MTGKIEHLVLEAAVQLQGSVGRPFSHKELHSRTSLSSPQVGCALYRLRLARLIRRLDRDGRYVVTKKGLSICP